MATPTSRWGAILVVGIAVICCLIPGAPVLQSQDLTSERDTVVTDPIFLTPSLRHGIDTSVSPCVDFDAYANGGWRASTVLPPKVNQLDVFRTTSTQTQAFLTRLLDSVRQVAATTTDPEIRVVGTYYESCLRADTLDRMALTSSMAGSAKKSDTSRAARCQRLTLQDLHDAMGHVFIRALMPQTLETRVQQLIASIREAIGTRLQALNWMDPDAKAKGQRLLETMKLHVAQPATKVDLTNLLLSPDDYLANRRAIRAHLSSRQLANIGSPQGAVFSMNQFTPNASYDDGSNSIEVPAFMFQRPFFDAGDVIMGYAAVGMVIGHEIYHGLTYVTHADGSNEFQRRRGQLIQQYDSLARVDSVPVNGALTWSENIADLGGLLAAYDAWQNDRTAQSKQVVEGFTPSQQFFLHYARLWRTKSTRLHLIALRGYDPHAPAPARINGVVMNIPHFAQAFGCREGDPMTQSAAKRVVIW